MENVHEKCAVVGAFGPDAAELTALALRAQDHRGPDSTGVGGMTKDGDVELHHYPGRARENLTEERIAHLGSLGIIAAVGHNRYATSGGQGKGQPIRKGEGSKTIIYAENGTASDTSRLEADMRDRGGEPAGHNDSEMAAWCVADRVKADADIVEAVTDAYDLYVGAHSVVVVGKGPDGEPMVVAYREPTGMRPLSWGQTPDGSWVVSSETVGLDAAGAVFCGEVPPGGMITINHEGVQHYQIAEPDPKSDPLEIIYFSNKKSRFKNVLIGDIREALGRRLAQEYMHWIKDGSVVVGVPNSAKPFAKGFAEEAAKLRVKLRPDTIKKHQDDRTFIQPDTAAQQALRETIYDIDPDFVDDEDTNAVDDSLFRKNTAPHITRMLRVAGARTVNFFIGSPPIPYPNFYGINTPTQEELVASYLNIHQIKESVGCDRIGYLSLQGMLDVFFEMTGEPADHFDLSGFTGKYPVSIGKNAERVRKVDFGAIAA